MQLSVIGKCPLFENTRILRSVDAQYTFWLKSLFYCYVAETYCAEKSNNLAARSLQNQFVTNLHEAKLKLCPMLYDMRRTLACT